MKFVAWQRVGSMGLTSLASLPRRIVRVGAREFPTNALERRHRKSLLRPRDESDPAGESNSAKCVEP